MGGGQGGRETEEKIQGCRVEKQMRKKWERIRGRGTEENNEMKGRK